MSSEATESLPALSSGTDALIEALIAVSGEVLAEVRTARQDIARARAEGGEQLWCAVVDARLADGFGIFRDGVEKVCEAAELRIAGEIIAATLPVLEGVPDLESRPRRHRKTRRWVPRQREALFLWPVDGIAAAPLAVKLAVVAAGAVITAGTVAGGTVIAHAVLSHPSAAAPSASPSVSALAPDPPAVPIPSSPVALTGAVPKPDAAKAGVVAQGPFPPAPSFTAPASSGPSPGPPSPAPPAAGTLEVPAQLDLGVTGTATLTVTASGGRVAWAALCADQDVTLDAAAGLLQDGDSAVITITVDAAALTAGGSAVIVLDPGHIIITVTWPAVPPPLPSPSPSLLPSPSPT